MKAFDANVISDEELDLLIAFFSASYALLEHLGEPFALQQQYMKSRFDILERMKLFRIEKKEKVVKIKREPNQKGESMVNAEK